MNYRHIYHAGNFADVFKHAVMTLILDYIAKKDKPFSVVDSHAGVGLYDLTSSEAKRSPEFEEGIGRLLTQKPIPETQRYVDVVRSFQLGDTLSFYPGSPLLAKHFLRQQDEMILNELHPEDYRQLKQNVKSSANIHCHKRDAYEFLLALLPPKNKRGLVIIDPPYEKETEFKNLLTTINQCLKRFSNGIYLIWYPIVSNQHEKWIKKIIESNNFPLLNAYFTRTAILKEKQGLIGNGVVVINPPFQIDKKINTLTHYLSDLFKLDDQASSGWFARLP